MIGPGAEEQRVRCALFAQVISRCGSAKLKAWGTSMVPSILPGDTLKVERAETSGFVAGDVAVYLRAGRLFVHRVVRVMDGPVSALVTRGDAMECEDPPVLADEIVGRVTSIVPGPRLAYHVRHILAALRNSLAMLFLAGAVVLLLLQG